MERGDGKRSDTTVTFHFQACFPAAVASTFACRFAPVSCVQANELDFPLLLQSARKNGPELIDAFVDTAYDYYKVVLP